MKKTILFLSILLAAQIGLGIALNLNRQQLAVFQPTASLLSFDKNGVDTITITGQEGKKVRLVKKDDKWVLPDAFNFPADQESVKRLLGNMADMKKDWPVATTAEAAERFKVSKDNFERHIILHQGDKPVVDLFVGTSPGFRKVHVRMAGSNDVLAVKFSTYEAGVTADNWIDKNYLHLDEKTIKGISLPGIDLIRKGGNLVLADLAADEEMNKEAVDTLTGQVAKLSIESILGRQNKKEYNQDKPKLTCSVQIDSGSKRIYTFSQPEKKDWFVLKSPDSDLYFKIGGWQVKPLLDAKRDSLVKKKESKQKQETSQKEIGIPGK